MINLFCFVNFYKIFNFYNIDFLYAMENESEKK